MADENELRARIEALIAARREGVGQPERDWPAGAVEGDVPSDAAGIPDQPTEILPLIPRSLEPVRPWLVGESIHLDVESDPAPPWPQTDPTAGAEGSRTLDPVRPWLRRQSSEPDTASPTTSSPFPEFPPLPPLPSVDGEGGAERLDPVRPWLYQRPQAEPEPPPALPDDDPVPPPPRRDRPEPRLLPGRPADDATADEDERHGHKRGWLHRRGGDDEPSMAEWLAPPETAEDDQPPLPPSAVPPPAAQAPQQPAQQPAQSDWHDILPPDAVGRADDPVAAPSGDPFSDWESATQMLRPVRDIDPDPAPPLHLVPPLPPLPPPPADVALDETTTIPPVRVDDGPETFVPGTDLPRRLASAGATPPVGDSFAAEGPPPRTDDGADDVEPDRPRRRFGALKVLVVVLVVAAAAAALLRAYVAAPYYVPTASMEPTLHGCKGCNNDHVLVNKLSYKTHDIRRGDVVVFHRPTAWQVPDKILIKRVIGLPGEVLTTRKGVVYVNGLALDEPYLNTACKGGTAGFPARSVTVPADDVFVMGDNRCDSSDSRRFGAIPDSSVIGRAFVTVWPAGRIHWL